ncbi:ankyrin repeat-containing domain protein [Chytridium lagenaria]|nr:ankyrin repeat-containing domain protein [Chytridium lagenaria]
MVFAKWKSTLNVWLGVRLGSFFPPTSEKSVAIAARSGNLELVKFLYKKRLQVKPDSLNDVTNEICAAAETGHLGVVRFFCEPQVGYRHNPEIKGRVGHAIAYAAEFGHLNIVRYLHRRSSVTVLLDALDRAAEKGHLDIVRFLNSSMIEPANARALDLARSNKQDAVYEYLLYHTNAKCSNDLLCTILESPDPYPMLPKVVDRFEDSYISQRAIELAVRTKKLEVVQELLRCDVGVKWGNAIDLAVELGQEDMLELFYDVFAAQPTRESVIDLWAELGQVKGVKYMESRMKCQTTWLAMIYAVSNGHFEMVKYLLESRGYQVEECGHMEILEFLRRCL